MGNRVGEMTADSSDHEEKVGPHSFIVHQVLGKGSFGEVYLVEKLSNHRVYAMKVLSKQQTLSQNLLKYVLTERDVLSITTHPFIVRLNYAFQTNSKLYLILDYCPGGDLSEYIEREKRFTEERARIYLAEVLLALEDLHRRDIIYRDLKPDNVVLDEDGHALLTDFGLSKQGVMDNVTAKSFCGSVAYLAPEMLKRTGHGKAVDWYLFGVLMYEMLVGQPPYFHKDKYAESRHTPRIESSCSRTSSGACSRSLHACLRTPKCSSSVYAFLPCSHTTSCSTGTRANGWAQGQGMPMR